MTRTRRLMLPLPPGAGGALVRFLPDPLLPSLPACRGRSLMRRPGAGLRSG